MNDQELLILQKKEILDSPLIMNFSKISIYDLDLPEFLQIDGELKVEHFPNTKDYKIFIITKRTKDLVVKIKKTQKILRISQDSFVVFNKKEEKEDTIQEDLKNELIENLTQQISKLIESLNNLRGCFFQQKDIVVLKKRSE